ncbi:peptide ABC transporter permease [Enterovirga sp.]|uniref:peptide ABC transporter permease n=1 Tax=Enterovirga sp. TaxID=2026350 RepID=UPI002D14B387|nr:peptide ABC transporter permease [Enterovirga sp.]HMO29411.1 peptide ABC transporter permease [Enterovirga sp.]
MASENPPPLDPARDTASLLRRLGVLVLMVALPLSAAAFRVGPVVAYAVGIVLLGVAAFLDNSPRFLRESTLAIASSPAFLAALLAFGWGALSLVWTPTPGWRLAAGLGAILLLGLCGIAALPERMRSANLYPIPIGAGALALVAIGLAVLFWRDQSEERIRQLERMLAILVLFAWPAIAWLRSRGRDAEALALAVATAVAAALGPGPAPILALAAGTLAHLAAQLTARAVPAVGLLLAAGLVASPALLALAHALPLTPEATAGVGRWHGLLLDQPARLLTGHGFGSLRALPEAPALFGAPALSLWYEFGVVGVLAVAVAILSALARVPALFGPLAPGIAGAGATAGMLGASGIGGGALWWPAALATLALLFVAAQRGRFRTRRPRALADFVTKAGP